MCTMIWEINQSTGYSRCFLSYYYIFKTEVILQPYFHSITNFNFLFLNDLIYLPHTSQQGNDIYPWDVIVPIYIRARFWKINKKHLLRGAKDFVILTITLTFLNHMHFSYFLKLCFVILKYTFDVEIYFLDLKWLNELWSAFTLYLKTVRRIHFLLLH